MRPPSCEKSNIDIEGLTAISHHRLPSRTDVNNVLARLAATPKFEVKRHGAAGPSNDCLAVPPGGYFASNFAGSAGFLRG